MGYFALIPEDAIEDEHLTFIWCGKDFDERADMDQEIAGLNLLCPFLGFVFLHSRFNGKQVHEIALPHYVHVTRHLMSFNFERSSYPWKPHITQGRWRQVGSPVKFVRAEWRA